MINDLHCSGTVLRYHGRWIFTKNAKDLLLAVQIEETEINILQNEWGGGEAFLLFKIKKKSSFQTSLTPYGALSTLINLHRQLSHVM